MVWFYTGSDAFEPTICDWLRMTYAYGICLLRLRETERPRGTVKEFLLYWRCLCCWQRVFKDEELSVVNTCLSQLDFMANFRHRSLWHWCTIIDQFVQSMCRWQVMLHPLNVTF